MTMHFGKVSEKIERKGFTLATKEMQPMPPIDQPTVEQLPHHQVKVKKPLQRSCNEKDEKGKICGGHLKRWFYQTDIVEQECGDVAQLWGPAREVYRCEHCKTLYLPNPGDPATLNVAGRGKQSVCGIGAGVKESK